jgi:hypothetical protein
MSNNTIFFARPRHTYTSYADYYHLIELSGFPLIYVDEIEMDSDNVYIFSTPEAQWWKAFAAPRRARLIYWDLEHYPDVEFFDTNGVEVWATDPAYANQKNVRFVLMGSHSGLALSGDEHPRPSQFEYDAILLAYMTYRRQVIEGGLKERGLRVAPNQNLHGMERDAILKQTRAMIHVHQRDDYQALAPQRFALAAAYRLPLITETLPEHAPFGYSNLLMSSHEHLPAFAQMWLGRNDSRILEDYGWALHSFLCRDNTFRQCVERAL